MTEPDQRDFVLLVQANPIVGLDLADAVAGAGGRVREPFGTAAEGQRWRAGGSPALTALDLAAADDDGARLAPSLRRRGVPFPARAESGTAAALADFAESPLLTEPAWPRDVVHVTGEPADRAGRAQ